MSKSTASVSTDDFGLVEPTKIRYQIIAVATLAAVLLYVERVCISVAEGSIRAELGLSNEQMSWALGIFFWAYALAQVPSGWLSDRYGPRLMLTIYLLAWSLFSAGTAFIVGFGTLLFARFAFGLSQAGAYPTASVLIDRWSPRASKGVASGIVAFGGRFGLAFAPILTVMMMIWLAPVVGTQATFESPDILDKPAAFQRFFWASDPQNNDPYQPFLQRIKQRFPSGALDQASKVAARLEETKRIHEQTSWPNAFESKKALSESLNKQVSAQDIELFRDMLNRSIHDPLLVEGIDFSKANVPSQIQGILNRPANERSNVEYERMHRILLEQAMPKVFRDYHGGGWRAALVVYGILGLVVIVIYWKVARDWPRHHPKCNWAEISMIERDGKTPESMNAYSQSDSKTPLSLFYLNGNLWFSSLNQFLTNLGWAFLVTWLPRYLDEQFSSSIQERGILASIPGVFGAVGLLLGGWLTDRMVKKVGPRWGRSLPMALTKFLCALAFLACPYLPSAVLVTCAFALVAFGTDLGSPAHWAFTQDVGGRRVGAVMGWTNMWGNFGAGLSPIALNFMINTYHNWDAAFLLCALAFAIAGVACLLVDATKPVETLKPMLALPKPHSSTLLKPESSPLTSDLEGDWAPASEPDSQNLADESDPVDLFDSNNTGSSSESSEKSD